MPEHFGFVAAAFAVVLGSMGGYALWIRARAARLRAELSDARSGPSADGSHDRRATR